MLPIVAMGPRPAASPSSPRFSRWHLGIFAALWLPFTALTFFIVRRGLFDGAERPGLVVATTAATILGPMTGAVSRNFQDCCLQASLSLLPVTLTVLVAATLVQVICRPHHPSQEVARLVIWAAGWFVWFASGILSFGHALG